MILFLAFKQNIHTFGHYQTCPLMLHPKENTFGPHECQLSQYSSTVFEVCIFGIITFIEKCCFFLAAWVLPSVPHQERLRGDRAEHLPPQPGVRRHVLGAGVTHSEETEETEKAVQDHTYCGSTMSLCTDAPTDLFIGIERQWTKQTAQTVATSSQIRGKEVTKPKGSSNNMFTASRLMLGDKIFNFYVPRICSYNILTGLSYVINQHESCINALLCVYGLGFSLYVKCTDKSRLRVCFKKFS